MEPLQKDKKPKLLKKQQRSRMVQNKKKTQRESNHQSSDNFSFPEYLVARSNLSLNADGGTQSGLSASELLESFPLDILFNRRFDLNFGQDTQEFSQTPIEQASISSNDEPQLPERVRTSENQVADDHSEENLTRQSLNTENSEESGRTSFDRVLPRESESTADISTQVSESDSSIIENEIALESRTSHERSEAERQDVEPAVSTSETQTSSVGSQTSTNGTLAGDLLIQDSLSSDDLDPGNLSRELNEEDLSESDSSLQEEPQNESISTNSIDSTQETPLTEPSSEESETEEIVDEISPVEESVANEQPVEDFTEDTLSDAESEGENQSSSLPSPPSGSVLLGPVVGAIRQRAAGLPNGEITAGTAASRRAEALSNQAQENQQQAADGVRDSAANAMPPVPEDLPASILGEDNPVPGITQVLDAASNQRLENQSPPNLEESPQGNWPVLGSRPVSPSTMRRLREIDMETPPVGEQEEQQRQGLLALRERLSTPPEVAEGYQGEVPALVDVPPPAHPQIPERNKTRLSQALARLLANPSGEAQDMIRRARGNAFVGGVLNQIEATQTLGDDTMVSEFAGVLGVQLDEIRAEAGIAAEDLDREVQNRQEELDRQHAEQEERLQMCLVDERANVADANQQVANTIAGARRGMDEQVEEVQAASGGESKRQAIESRRDRIIADINRHVGTEKSDYRRAGETRQNELTTSESAQINAYRFAAQQDEFQLTTQRDEIIPTESEMQRAPQGTDPYDFAVQDRIARSNRWKDGRIRSVRGSFTTLKTEATTAISGFQTEIEEAGNSAREDIRNWANEELGEEESWWDSIINMLNDWMGEAEAEAEAWETVQNQETVVVASGYIDMLDQVERSAAAGITQEQMLARSDLTAEERAVIEAYFNPPEGTVGRDPIGAVAHGLKERIFSQRGPEITSRMESQVKDSQPWNVLDRVGRAYTSDFDAANRASQLEAAFRPGLTGLGTEEEQVFSALSGLNPVQAKAVRKAYQHFYHRTLEEALAAEMDTDGEANRAQALLSGNQAAADAAALHMAMEETFLNTGLGTDRDVIMTTLRNKSPEEIAAITEAYESTYPGDSSLRELLQEELNDWATLSTHDSDMAMAYMDSNTALADAIAIDQSMHGFSWGYAFNLAYGTDFEEGGRDEFTAVTDRIRQEVAAQASSNEWDERQFQAELSRRLAEVESAYNSEYSYRGSLRTAIEGRFDEGPNRDLLEATLDNDEIRADAARVAIERYESIVYASDDVIIDVVERRYDRALEAERRNRGPLLRLQMETQLSREDQAYFEAHGVYMTGAQRYARQQELEVEMERELESAARDRAERDTQRLDEVFSEEYGDQHNEDLEDAVRASTSGTTGEHAVTALSQGGYLTRDQRFEYAVGGYLDGTDEEALQRAIEGATPEELRAMDQRWRDSHGGESLFDRALSETSGTDNMDMQVALMGRPMTIDQALRRERLRVQLEQPTNWFGEQIAGPEREILDYRMAEMEANARQLKEPVRTQADRDRRDQILNEFEFNQQAVQGAVQQHRSRVAAVTDAVANAASMAVAIAVGALITVVSGGSAGPVAVALIASLAATMTSIGTRALLMGNQYGQEEFLTDVGIGVVDAIVAAATAGIGNRLLGISQVSRAVSSGAVGSGIRGTMRRVQQGLARMLARLGDVGPVARRVQASQLLQNMAKGPWYKRLAAHAVAESVENAVGALPTAVVGEVINDKNWEGGFQFGNAFTNVATGVGMGVGMGLGMSGGMAGLGHIASFARNRVTRPNVGGDLHFSSPDHLPTNDAQYNAALDAYTSRPNPDGTPRTQADFDAALQRERQRHLDSFMRQNQDATEADFDAQLEQHATARRTEFDEMHGGRKDFDVEAGREAGEQIQRVDSEQKQRQQYADEVRDAAPEGRGDIGEIPVTVLSEADFKRLGVDGDSTVVMRDGQAHLVVKEGAEPASVRHQAQSLADQTAAGTGGRSVNPADALPKDLRGRVNVDVNPDLPPRSVEVHYESHNGVIIGMWIEVGPGARSVDIQMHAQTVRSMRKLQGISGRVRQLLNRMRRWANMNPAPPPGSRAFEARLEMEKLPGIIQERANALRNATSPDEQIRLMAEVEHLKSQMENHSRFVNAVESEPGVGYVAAKGLDQPALTKALGKIEDPDARAAIAAHTEDAPVLAYYHKLINDITAGLNSPADVRAAVDAFASSFRRIDEVIRSADGKPDLTIMPRMMNRAQNSPDGLKFLTDMQRVLDNVDSDSSGSILRKIAYMDDSSVASRSLSGIVDAAGGLIDNNLPEALNGQLIKAALEASPADRGNVMRSLARIAENADEALMQSIADRLNGYGSGTSGRGAMSADSRAKFLNQMSTLMDRAQALADSKSQYSDLVDAMILGATDAQVPDKYFGKVNQLLSDLEAHASSPDAGSIRAMNTLLGGIDDTGLRSVIDNAPDIDASTHTSKIGTQDPEMRSSGRLLDALQNSDSAREIEGLAATIKHITEQSIKNPDTIGKQFSETMGRLSTHVDSIINRGELPAHLRSALADIDASLKEFHLRVDDTFTFREGERRIPDELYESLRSGTPSKKVLDEVAARPGETYTDANGNPLKQPFDDPVFDHPDNTTTMRVEETLEADHIVPMAEIVKMPGFERLTREQQLAVLNHQENFMALSKSANASKGDSSFEEWTVHKSSGSRVNEEFRQRMITRERELRVILQDLINEKLAE
ncbi:hypothetical protein FLL45_20380 [Aliikangiella marina]|uniref:Annexin n=1 Tax=Aliikangiella marina TaxID=1712262 RepID=A0A545T2R1_9GAMM|nr:hypothetical protein [Aliikangiella marina]TQV71511.1 hypothetical protein FLL45_20380 [Aliikangiella marina]